VSQFLRQAELQLRRPASLTGPASLAPQLAAMA
jgi:hypothetical protein